MVGLTQTTFRANEAEAVTVCTRLTAGEISHPVVVRIQTGYISDLSGSK